MSEPNRMPLGLIAAVVLLDLVGGVLVAFGAFAGCRSCVASMHFTGGHRAFPGILYLLAALLGFALLMVGTALPLRWYRRRE